MIKSDRKNTESEEQTSTARTLYPSTIRARLILSFSIAILIPVLITAFVGIQMINRHVIGQAQVQINSDLEAAREIYNNQLNRLRDMIRIYASNSNLTETFDKDLHSLQIYLDRIQQEEHIDILTVVDLNGRVIAQARPGKSSEESRMHFDIVKMVLQMKMPVAGTMIMTREDLLKESPDLVSQAEMKITPTPRARPSEKEHETSGMFLMGGAPILKGGRLVGALYGGILLNRNYQIVDTVKQTVFKAAHYKGREVGTATIFMNDLRVSTNVKNRTGSRAITTRVSSEVAESVLDKGRTWKGRAFVVNDWYISAYSPIISPGGTIIGMLYVGTLERPYTDKLRRSLLIFLSIALMGVLGVTGVAIHFSSRISRPIRALALASQKVARGDFDQQVESSSIDEIGYLAVSFKTMIAEVTLAQKKLQEWGDTLEKKVEERTRELKTMQDHLIQTEKMAAIGKLAAGVAHEINNPLTGILTNASLMLEEMNSDNPYQEELNIIVDETLRCRKIVRGLLEFSRQKKPQKEHLDLGKAVSDVLGLVQNQASFKKISCVNQFPGDMPSVWADVDQIRQVILNIVINAAEAMDSGGTIRIRGNLDTDRQHVNLVISDTGQGIPDDIRRKLFEPFFSTKQTGTGLGLTIVYGIVQRHGGKIDVQSIRGTGTTVTVSLPVDKVVDHE